MNKIRYHISKMYIEYDIARKNMKFDCTVYSLADIEAIRKALIEKMNCKTVYFIYEELPILAKL